MLVRRTEMFGVREISDRASGMMDGYVVNNQGVVS